MEKMGRGTQNHKTGDRHSFRANSLTSCLLEMLMHPKISAIAQKKYSGSRDDRHHNYDGGGNNSVIHQQDGSKDILHQNDRRLADLLLQHHHRHDDYPHLHGHLHQEGPRRSEVSFSYSYTEYTVM